MSTTDALVEALCAYVTQYGLRHEDGCPEDDTCECSITVSLSKALDEAIANCGRCGRTGSIGVRFRGDVATPETCPTCMGRSNPGRTMGVNVCGACGAVWRRVVA